MILLLEKTVPFCSVIVDSCQWLLVIDFLSVFYPADGEDLVIVAFTVLTKFSSLTPRQIDRQQTFLP